MKKLVSLVVLGFFIFCLPVFALESIDFLTGYLEADLDRQGDYQALPLLLGFNFNGDAQIEKLGIKLPWQTNFIIEPFLNPVIGPKTNLEAGFNLLAKFTFPVFEKARPYIKGGVGVLYMSQHTYEQSTKYNFLPQVGGGLQYFLNEKVAVNFEYRYRHLSNASTKSPNRGIDADLFLCGFSFFLD